MSESIGRSALCRCPRKCFLESFCTAYAGLPGRVGLAAAAGVRDVSSPLVEAPRGMN